jgi:KUP system potassium uptake protein
MSTAVRRTSLAAVIGVTGIVFGDIGTSPIYAFELSMKATGSHGPEAVFGVLSLIFWALAISVTLKYVVVMMRADNDGEGGILALLALAQRQLVPAARLSRVLVGLALAGTALFFCDALITPAVSVLSAIEGLELINPDLQHTTVPITLIVLAILFAMQRRGTEHVARLFGPVMILWFLVLAISGAAAIAVHPEVVVAVDPRYGIALLVHSPGVALAILGSVFLALTGGEALYADMGHFGAKPVRIAWFALVLPALLLNYYGQGARALGANNFIEHPLYLLVPSSMLPFMLILCTAATVIASQAVISGAFSIARQAMQLDLLPRMRVLQTSALELGQIYVPVVNGLLAVAVMCFVVGFGSSDALANAYGVAVVGTMIVTTVLGSFVAMKQWGWPPWTVVALFGVLIAMDAIFMVGNLTKIDHGGWIPLTLGAVLFGVFSIWRNGRTHLRAALARMAVPRAALPKLLKDVYRVQGTGVFLASDSDIVPSALIRNLEHNHVAHERILILNIEITRTPRQDPSDRVRIQELMPNVYAITAIFGFMETPAVGDALKTCRTRGLRVFAEDSSFFVGQHVVRARPRPGLPGIQRKLFARMQRRSTQAAEFFRMPARGLVILTTDVEV